MVISWMKLNNNNVVEFVEYNVNIDNLKSLDFLMMNS